MASGDYRLAMVGAWFYRLAVTADERTVSVIQHCRSVQRPRNFAHVSVSSVVAVDTGFSLWESGFHAPFFARFDTKDAKTAVFSK